MHPLYTSANARENMRKFLRYILYEIIQGRRPEPTRLAPTIADAEPLITTVVVSLEALRKARP